MVAPTYFDEDEVPPRPVEEPHTVRGIAHLVWGVCVTVLLAPPLLVWIVRGVAYAAQCAPGPAPCQGMLLGAGLRDTFALSWVLSSNVTATIAIALIATLAGMITKHPLRAAAGLLLLPLAALILPMLAVYLSQYDGCKVGTDVFGECTLWGARMGESFQNAANVPDMVMSFAPYSFAMALMLGVLSWFITRPRSPRRNDGAPFSDRGH